MKKFYLYYLYEDDKLIGKYTINEIAEMLNYKPKSIQRCIDNDTVIEDKYRIFRTDTTDELLKKWDEARLIILNAKPRKIIVKKKFSIWKDDTNQNKKAKKILAK